MQGDTGPTDCDYRRLFEGLGFRVWRLGRVGIGFLGLGFQVGGFGIMISVMRVPWRHMSSSKNRRTGVYVP